MIILMQNKKYQKEHLSFKVPRINLPQIHAAGAADYADALMHSLKLKVNDIKSRQDEWYQTDKCPNYSKIQSNVDLYKDMRRHLMDDYGAQLVTNAWMKYYEIYLHYDLVKPNNRFRAFCNAELPGASICTLNHIIKTLHPAADFDWRACSLILDRNSVSTTQKAADALGDHYGIWSQNRDKWLMTVGADDGGYYNNGDATNLNNIYDYERRIGPSSQWGGADLYSHDAGIDVGSVKTETGDSGYNEQEKLDAHIHLGCALAGFATLRIGGSFIAKQYTFFEPFTYDLIFIYASLFDEFYLCKPLTSRPFNSEIYLIGKGFRGLPPDIRDALEFRIKNYNFLPFFAAADMHDHVKTLLPFAETVFGQQCDFILENIEFYKQWCQRRDIGFFMKSFNSLKYARMNTWLKTYPMKKIDFADHLPSLKHRDFRS